MAGDIALFIHLLGVASLFVAIGISQVGASRLRRAVTVEEVRTWAGLIETTGRIFPLAIIVILGAGIYMAADTWGFDRPFVIVGIGTVVILLIIGGAYVGRGFSAIDRAFEAEGSHADEIPRLVRRPALHAANTGLNGMVVGLIWVMVSKPDFAGSISTVAGLGVVGAVLGSLSARRAPN